MCAVDGEGMAEVGQRYLQDKLGRMLKVYYMR